MSNPRKVEQLRRKATQLHRDGCFGEAEKLYRRILILQKSDVEARHMIGVLRLQQGRALEALQMVDPLLKQQPANPYIRTHRGLILHELGRHDEALAELEISLAIKPNNPMTLLYRGNVQMEVGLFERALENYNSLLKIVPDYGEAWFRRGSTLWLMDKYEEAFASYTRALTCDPNHVAALFNCGTTLLKLERYDEAYSTFEKVRVLVPGHRHVLGGLASAVMASCNFPLWRQYQALLAEGVRTGNAVIAPLVFLPFCDDGWLRRKCSENFVKDRIFAPRSSLWTGERYHHKRIRLAYMSSDFQQHATAHLISGLIECHDRRNFEVTAISFGADDKSAERARLMKAFDEFIDVRQMTDAAIATLLREREIDIAVDLKGHTEGARAGILAYRPCPVQVSYLGYPGTIAAPWLDYIIADQTVLPISEQHFYSEKIIHLPHCYQVNDSLSLVDQGITTREDAGLPQDAFVFCCFNAAWKITPDIFQIWMRLLASVPKSILWLLEDNMIAVQNLRAAATQFGLDPARLVFAPRIAFAAHLARHRLADLFLDTIPYNAHTTASDALRSGLPIVTCLGKQFDGRVAASLLRTLGMDELVTESLLSYEALALDLARNPARLESIRFVLAKNRGSGPLYDTQAFRQSLEMVYAQILQTVRHIVS